jgi:uncharacterized hydrophobic protein (TIGR00271 family)
MGILQHIKLFLANRFSLAEDKADEQVIVDSIKRDVSFKGSNLWTLIFAIFIASIGLNVNSTAVIIGAMLISPLMGPIMGIGLSIGINDFQLLKKGAKNLFIATVISITTSFLYFTITPLHDASSELLARTTPTLWDVFIAFLGGLSGIVAGTRRVKSNVLPGVAIATALMPPLCTAGFGLATGKIFYFLGALYLFFINSVFICLATFIIVRHLRFHKVEFSSAERQKRVTRYITFIVIITVMPSIYLAYRIVQRSIFENNAEKFVQEQFHFTNTQVVTRNYSFDGKQPVIELLLVGQHLPENVIGSLQKKLATYNIANTRLVVRQGLDAKQKIDLNSIKASVLEEVFAKQQKDTLPGPGNKLALEIPPIRTELEALYPSLRNYTLQQSIVVHTDTTHPDTITLFIGSFKPALPRSDRQKLQYWLKQRINTDSVKLILE